jgi:hypothetical protein
LACAHREKINLRKCARRAHARTHLQACKHAARRHIAQGGAGRVDRARGVVAHTAKNCREAMRAPCHDVIAVEGYSAVAVEATALPVLVDAATGAQDTTRIYCSLSMSVLSMSVFEYVCVVFGACASARSLFFYTSPSSLSLLSLSLGLPHLKERDNLIRQGNLVLDLGSAPGSWTQAHTRTHARTHAHTHTHTHTHTYTHTST